MLRLLGGIDMEFLVEMMAVRAIAWDALRLQCGTRFIVQMMTGKTITLDIEDSAMDDVKATIQETAKCRPDRQRFIFVGTQLQDCRTLSAYNVQKQSKLKLESPAWQRAFLRAESTVPHFRRKAKGGWPRASSLHLRKEPGNTPT